MEDRHYLGITSTPSECSRHLLKHGEGLGRYRSSAGTQELLAAKGHRNSWCVNHSVTYTATSPSSFSLSSFIPPSIHMSIRLALYPSHVDGGHRLRGSYTPRTGHHPSQRRTYFVPTPAPRGRLESPVSMIGRFIWRWGPHTNRA